MGEITERVLGPREYSGGPVNGLLDSGGMNGVANMEGRPRTGEVGLSHINYRVFSY